MALTKKYVDKTIKIPKWEGNGENMYVSGEEDMTYRAFSGWHSDVTNEFYAVDERYLSDPMIGGIRFQGRDMDSQYQYSTENSLKLKETEFLNNKETARIKAEQEAERARWRQQEETARQEAARLQQEAEQMLRDQQTKFENERIAREQAKAAAEKAKQEKLAGEAKITGQTFLEDMQRMTDVRDNDLVAEEDKKVLTADDKTELFTSGQGEEEQKKVKQTFLDRILGTSPAGTPNAKQ